MGVHSDQVIRYHSGEGYPITNLQERALSVLGCRYVKDILIGSPWSVTADMIVVLKVDFFIAGTVRCAYVVVYTLFKTATISLYDGWQVARRQCFKRREEFGN
ncbi:hypothetical protein Zmor_016348 [Zophobas morio]|uniref:Uncharacterized protein n=1 Tax=Zophobas morio TaxID=2755281 RepID=A0AA38LZE9_9CUCU|nr:hypothetical protein Zmor_016348 [Zophobas morio]